jgi:hypothetical protein
MTGKTGAVRKVAMESTESTCRCIASDGCRSQATV